RFHVGTSEVGARVVARVVTEGGPFAARLSFDEPVVLRAGDRFVLRTSAPLNTIGGGVITDPYAPRRARAWPPGLSVEQRLERLVGDADAEGADVQSLPVRLGVSPSDCGRRLRDSGERYVQCGRRLVTRETFERVQVELFAAVERHHETARLEPGIAQAALRTRTQASAEVVEAAIEVMLSSGKLWSSSGNIAVSGWEPKPSEGDRRLIE